MMREKKIFAAFRHLLYLCVQLFDFSLKKKELGLKLRTKLPQNTVADEMANPQLFQYFIILLI